MAVVLRSILQCPHCGFKVTEPMSAARCVLRYECPACRFGMQQVTPERCIFCSYGSVGCPDFQQSAQCCAGRPEDEQQPEASH
jgi:hypothetical protein